MNAAAAQSYPHRGVREAVSDLIRRGLLLVPVPFGAKGPTLKGWPHLRIGLADVPRHFTEQHNVGVLLGDYPTGKALCDTDFDVPEAARAAPRRLAFTPMRHGRLSKPESHWWHWTELGCPTKKYVDPTDNKSILERRCNAAKDDTALQTNVPPSINPSGEEQRWSGTGEPTFVTIAELTAQHDDIAGVALLARHLVSGRHEGAMHFAGLLARRDVDLDRMKLLLAMLADALDLSGRVDEFERLAEDTHKAVAAGKNATGGKKLIEHLDPNGKKIVARVAEWLGLQQDAASADDSPPLDLWGSHLAGKPCLNLGDVPAVLAELAADLSERIGCDPALVALPALAVCAGAIDDRHEIQPREHDTTWRTAARLWVVGAEDVSGGKSPALSAALKPLQALDEQWAKEDKPALARHELQLRLYNKQAKKWVDSGGHGPPPEEPERPPARRRVVDDITTEALSDVLVDNPAGVIFGVDELTGLIGGLDAYRPAGVAKDQPLYLSLKEGGPRSITRVRRGRIVVPNWGASIVGGIQPERLRQISPRMLDDGLLARCLVFFGQGRGEGLDQVANFEALDRYTQTIRALAALPLTDTPFTLSPEAHLRRQYVVRVSRAMQVLPTTAPGLAAHLGKWEGEFARLLLTYHLTIAAAAGELPNAEIGVETADMVARLMVSYLLPHAAHLYGELLGQDHLTHARWIAGHILAQRLDKVSLRDIGRVYHGFRDDRRALENAMQTLSLAGWTVPIDQAPGHPPTRWRVQPAVHSLFGARAQAERLRRDEIMKRISDASRTLGLDEDAA